MAKKIYKAHIGSRISDKDATIIGERIETVFNGQITATQLLNDAKSKTSPIHDYFDWDDTSAAHEYRLEQARRLIRAIDVIVISNGEEVDTKAFHHISVTDDKESYVSYNQIFSNKNYYDQVIENALKEADSWQNRYASYKELSLIFKSIEQTKNKIKENKNKIKTNNLVGVNA